MLVSQLKCSPFFCNKVECLFTIQCCFLSLLCTTHAIFPLAQDMTLPYLFSEITVVSTQGKACYLLGWIFLVVCSYCCFPWVQSCLWPLGFSILICTWHSPINTLFLLCVCFILYKFFDLDSFLCPQVLLKVQEMADFDHPSNCFEWFLNNDNWEDFGFDFGYASITGDLFL